MTKKKVYILHTSFVSADYLKALFAELVPGAELYHIVDDSLLAEITRNGGVTPGVIRRYCTYAMQAEAEGADLIFSQCSSAGPCADAASLMVSVPILKVDRQMAEDAVEVGGKIAVVATLETTLRPSVKLIEDVIAERGATAEIVPVLVKGAFEELTAGRREVHDRMLTECLLATAKQVDVITLAQGSMAVLADGLGDVGVPLMSSPRRGVIRAGIELGL